MGIFNRDKKKQNAVQINDVSEQQLFYAGWSGIWSNNKKGWKPFGRLFLQTCLNQIYNGVSNVSFESLKDNYVANAICNFVDNNASVFVSQWLRLGFMAASYTKDHNFAVIPDNELRYDSNRRVVNRDAVVIYSPQYQIGRKGYMPDAMPIVGLLDTLGNTLNESCNVMGVIPILSGSSIPANPDFKRDLSEAMSHEYGWGADQMKYFLSRAEIKVDKIDLQIKDLELRDNLLSNFKILLNYFEVPVDLVIGNSTYANVGEAKTYFYDTTIRKYAEAMLKVARNLLTASEVLLPQNTLTYHITNVKGLDTTLSDRCKERGAYIDLLLKLKGEGVDVSGEVERVYKDIKKDYLEV